MSNNRMQNRIFRGIPNNHHLPKSAHKLADRLREVEAQYADANKAAQQYSINVQHGLADAKKADRDAAANAALDGKSIPTTGQNEAAWHEAKKKAEAKRDAHLDATKAVARDFKQWLTDHRTEVEAHNDALIAKSHAEYQKILASLDAPRDANREAQNARAWINGLDQGGRVMKYPNIDREPAAEYAPRDNIEWVSPMEAAVRQASALAKSLGH